MSSLPPKSVTNRLKALVHIAKADLGLSDEAYRTILASLTRKESTAGMGLSELNAVLNSFRAKGWMPKVKRSKLSRQIENSREQKKIWKLWYLLRDAGACDGTRKGLNAWLKKQTGVESIDWIVTYEAARPAIEGLKAWCKRVGAEVYE
ncbi:regulatory protein GemA [Pseudanabaena sp. PCC 6802]|uniref:regulatory protein GemA n=1 Tax=Pseudanabaena sp. PCC 6802 TaxID=118173 RepID=UPI00034D6BA2|nr:regulatory protein GemA [Pseudanabaena sp. PCC 6802]